MAADSLLSAQILALRTVRILFGAAGVGALTSDHTSLNPLVWSVVCAGPFPAYTPVPVSVISYLPSGAGELGADITLSAEVTEGAVYTFTATGITGIATSSISAGATNLLGFPASRDFQLIDSIPRVNVNDDTSGDMEKFIKVWQEPLNLLMFDIDHWVNIFDSELAPEAFLDLILSDLGNPFHFATELTLIKKRRLAALLVEIYKLKGTAPGAQQAISLLLNMRSEFFGFNGLGDELDTTAALGDDGTHPGTPPFHLGSGGPWRLLVKAGTTVASQTDAGQSSPAAGNALTVVQIDNILEILRVMLPCYLHVEPTGSGFVRWGCTPTVRNAIQRTNSTTAKLFIQPISGAAHMAFLQGILPRVQEFNAGSKITPVTAINALLGTSVTHGGSIFYWNGIGESTGQPAWDTEGLLGNEVTNVLLTAGSTATTLTVTPGSRKLHLSWVAVVNATRYRIYVSTVSMASPVVANNAATPIEVSGDVLTYDDLQETGTLKHYIVTPMIQDSEGFFSNDASGTAT